MPIRLDHVVLRCTDFDRTCEFYSRVLGAEVLELEYGRRALRLGEQQLNLHGPGSTPHPVAAHPASAGGFDACFVWEGSPEAAIAHLRSCGVEPFARGQPPGAREPTIAVNVRCLDGLDVSALSPKPFDGRKL